MFGLYFKIFLDLKVSPQFNDSFLIGYYLIFRTLRERGIFFHSAGFNAFTTESTNNELGRSTNKPPFGGSLQIRVHVCGRPKTSTAPLVRRMNQYNSLAV